MSLGWKMLLRGLDLAPLDADRLLQGIELFLADSQLILKLFFKIVDRESKLLDDRVFVLKLLQKVILYSVQSDEFKFYYEI